MSALLTVSPEHTAVRCWMRKRFSSRFSFLWCLKQFVHWPIATISPVKNLIIHLEFSCPLFKSEGLPLICNISRISLIVTLLLLCSPSAIFFAVIAFWIEAINTHSNGSDTHICKEIGKFVPVFTNFDSSPSIPTISSGIWIIAPLQHPSPDHVCACSCHSMFFDSQWLNASARFASSISQTTSKDFLFLTAATPAQPSLFIRDYFDCYPFSKALSWLYAFIRGARQSTRFIAQIRTVHAMYNIRMSS